jgi:hypothetical protein
LRRRSAVEPVIGHLKAEHRMGRNYLWFWHGDANNALLAAVGYNIRRLVRWLRILLRQFLSAPLAEPFIKSEFFWEESKHAWVHLPDGIQHFRRGRI